MIQGEIVSEPDFDGKKISYIIKTNQISDGKINSSSSGKILVNTRYDKKTKLLSCGDLVRLHATINIPKSSSYNKGFDYKELLVNKGISSITFVGNNVIEKNGNNDWNFIEKQSIAIRSKIRNIFTANLPVENAALLDGILIGDKFGLSERTKKNFINSGLSHEN